MDWENVYESPKTMLGNSEKREKLNRQFFNKKS